jgi:transposase
MVKKGELTDEAWARIAPLLPENGRRGGRWRDHREVVNGILWKLRTGAPWRDLPERYGPWQTCYDRFSRWRRDGTWDRLLADAQTKTDAVGEVEWLVSVDRGYSYPSCRLLLRQRGIRHTIPERSDQREHRAGRPGAPPRFDLDVYRKRNVAERCVNRFKQWRGIATRYEKRAANYRAMVVIAALMIWLSS